MPDRIEVRDLVVYVPGITGTELRKDGRLLWGATAPAVARAASSRAWRSSLALSAHDDGSLDDLGDGVEVGDVIQAFHIFPGLEKAIGPAPLHETLFQRLEFTAPTAVLAGNYREFPYDWRRSNRYSARRLKRFVEEALKGWKDRTGYDHARAILVAHSMGGLVCRYFLEVLGGWELCKALFTIATPHRGSVAIAEFIANGYRLPLLDLSDVVRTLTSAYELMAIYEVVEKDGRWTRIHETPELPRFDNARAVAARAFHDEIHEGTKAPCAHRRVVPWVGHGQPTLQSLHWTDSRVQGGFDVPESVDAQRGDGDGRVPRVSGIPRELSDLLVETYAPDTHAGMQQNEFLLGNLAVHIGNLQGRGLQHVAGYLPFDRQHAIGVNVHDAFAASETITFVLQPVVGYTEYEVIVRTESGTAMLERRVVAATPTTVGLGSLPPGMYSLSIATYQQDPNAPPNVVEVFGVIPENH
ncbi:MAG TPA: hypothetical protein VEK11_01625 [Thermoanaerobaculia bacterium]|nr:hypothetical protein [Thermoanaerobaculia bacterium]